MTCFFQQKKSGRRINACFIRRCFNICLLYLFNKTNLAKVTIFIPIAKILTNNEAICNNSALPTCTFRDSASTTRML